MKTTAFGVTAVIVLVSASLSAKGITSRITITADGRSAPIEITDPTVLEQFNVWAGRGTQANGVEQLDGFIIDWRSGIVAERPSGLRRFEVSFYVKYWNRELQTFGPEEKLAYVVAYETASPRDDGYVYLPGKADQHYRLNVGAIHRGQEGNWFRASDAWQRVVTRLLAPRHAALDATAGCASRASGAAR